MGHCDDQCTVKGCGQPITKHSMNNPFGSGVMVTLHQFIGPVEPPVPEPQPGAIDIEAYNLRTWRDIQVRTIAQKWNGPRTTSATVWEARIDNAIRDGIDIGLRAGRARGIEEERKRCEGIAREKAAARRKVRDRINEMATMQAHCDEAAVQRDLAAECTAIADAIAKETK